MNQLQTALENGLNLRQALVLHNMTLIDMPTMTEIAKWCKTSTAAATVLVDKLEKKNLVTRIRCDGDRRTIYVRLTDTGLDLGRKLLAQEKE